MGDTSERMDIEKLFSLANDLIGMLNDGKDGDNLMQSLENAKSLRSFCETNVHETNISLEEYQKRINACKERIEKVKGVVIADSKLNELQTELKEKMQMEHFLCQGLSVVGEELGNLAQHRISFEERWKLVKQREKDVQKSHALELQLRHQMLRPSLQLWASISKTQRWLLALDLKKALSMALKMATRFTLMEGEALTFPIYEFEEEKLGWEKRDSLSMCASVTGIILDHTNKTKICGFIVDRSKEKVGKFEFDPGMPPFEVCERMWKMSSQ